MRFRSIRFDERRKRRRIEINGSVAGGRDAAGNSGAIAGRFTAERRNSCDGRRA
jgi:hypothetical protein